MAAEQAIYLDYNASTPVDPEVLKMMLPYFQENFGNASSKTHAYGWKAEAAVEKARDQVANLIGAEAAEIIFTSGATESLNLAIKGVYEAYAVKGKHIISSVTEHKAVLDVLSRLEKNGAEITLLPVDREGRTDPEELRKVIREDTVLVAIMYANNETGVLQPINEISRIVHEAGSIFLCDATQACGKIRVDVNESGIDLLCISSHKLYGPKGSGALYIRRKSPRVVLNPQMDGGGHERGLRSGTLNVPGIVGLGAACELAGKYMWDEATRVSRLRTILEQQLEQSGACRINGSVKDRLPNTSNLLFPGRRAESLIKELGNIAIATGSACTSALPKPSHVLQAMGLSEEDAYCSLRFSLGRYTTEEEIRLVLKVFNAILNNKNQNP